MAVTMMNAIFWDLTRAHTWAVAVGSRRLTARAMARPQDVLLHRPQSETHI
jgi:hypothetical protein